MEENNIFKMELKDLEKIKNNLETDFDNFWNYNIFKSELENPNSIYFIYKKNNEIIAFIGIIKILDEADITNIVVNKNYRKMRYIKKNDGIFNKLLQTRKNIENKS